MSRTMLSGLDLFTLTLLSHDKNFNSFDSLGSGGVCFLNIFVYIYLMCTSHCVYTEKIIVLCRMTERVSISNILSVVEIVWIVFNVCFGLWCFRTIYQRLNIQYVMAELYHWFFLFRIRYSKSSTIFFLFLFSIRLYYLLSMK